MKMNGLIDLGHRIYEFLTNPKVVKISAIISAIVIISSIILGVIVAQFDPNGYNMFDNYVSDLGSIRHTPFPYFLDFAAMVTGITLIPVLFYMEKVLAPLPEKVEDLPDYSRMRLRLASIGFFWMLIGVIGWFFVGFFSEDRTTALRLHLYASLTCFIGLALGGFFFGLLITFYETIFPKILGLYMVIIPSIACAFLIFGGLLPIVEWIYFFSVMTWLTIGFFILIGHLKELT